VAQASVAIGVAIVTAGSSGAAIARQPGPAPARRCADHGWRLVM